MPAKISAQSSVNFQAHSFTELTHRLVFTLNAKSDRKGFPKLGPWCYETMLLIFFVFKCKNLNCNVAFVKFGNLFPLRVFAK